MNRTWRSCGRLADPVILQLKLMTGRWPQLWWLRSERDDSELPEGELQASCKVLQSLETAYLSKAFCYIRINVREYKHGNILRSITWNLWRISWASVCQLHKSSACSRTCLPALVGIICTRKYLKGQDLWVIIPTAMPKGAKKELQCKTSNKTLKHVAQKFWQSAVWSRQQWAHSRETGRRGMKGV